MAAVHIEGGNMDTGMPTGRTPCEDKGRDAGDTSPSQERQELRKTASKPQKPGERHEQMYLRVPGELTLLFTQVDKFK
jgi:hypothetical protein